MEDPACKVKCAQIQDIPFMLSLEKKYFPSCWCSEPTLIRRLIKQDPMMFRVCMVNGKIKGYYWVIPLEHSEWKKILTGEMKESQLIDHIKSFDEPNLYLYIAAVIVDIEDKQHKKYTKALVHDFNRHFVMKQTPNFPDIRSIGAFTISDGGQRLMERSNFSYNGNFEAEGQIVRSYSICRQALVEQTITTRLKSKQKSIA